ncbi:hypothetical protein GCK72_022912 [Caenorhabditis remanei]|uniref:Uncharacterized protein n=1 Tax=Caenorhabditis remanei TaxID=31234 RepID=A0A6A5FVA9_CAERE|nr:hypothetical protein GCK72_022912 [Caenorhabditis remanei]KAF1746456.1 hypothetical protein GCK72_022912 [Caenorhabditis remanei]
MFPNQFATQDQYQSVQTGIPSAGRLSGEESFALTSTPNESYEWNSISKNCGQNGLPMPILDQFDAVHSFSHGKNYSENYGNHNIPQSEHIMNHQQIMSNFIPTEMDIFETQNGSTMLPSHFEQEFLSALNYLDDDVQAQHRKF